ncbi:MAG: Flp pilus assembly complex ATPase component TadA [Candidatus Pacebacteria bacterium]|nr:Flp pilus assembly complex ATPase component TadA [Candidatus Paceibacterota bacterium]
MPSKQQELLNLLLAQNVISPDKYKELNKKISDNKQELVKILLNEKVIEEEKLTQYRAQIYGLEYKNLLNLKISEDILNFISEDVAKTYSIVCFEKNNREAAIGLVSPNLKAMEAVNFLAKESGLQIKYFLISRSSFNKLFKQYQKIEEEISSALESRAQSEGEGILEIDEDSEDLVDSADIDSAPVAKIVSVIIRHAVDGGASDIHIEPFEKESRVRYRVDGILRTSLVLPKHIHNAVVARIKVLSKLKLDETRVPQDGRIRLIVDGKKIDFRVSTLPVSGSHEKVVMRILDSSATSVKIELLGFNKHVLRVIKRNILKTNGIFLVTGPTGSGKTTTLYSLLHILNQEGVNISTLEDPVEYQLEGVNQSQIRPKIGYTFGSGLRSFLRQDPDIIMVGEIRDQETAELSVHAGLTGHFVLSTLHTNDAISTILRLMDMNVEPFLLASTLKAALSQRLTRKLCKHCKEAVDINDKIKEDFINEMKNLPERIWKEEMGEAKIEDIANMKIYQAKGCSRCDNIGYKGRLAIAEVVEILEPIRLMIEKEEHIGLEEVRKTQDFITIKQDGYLKVLKGTTSLDEVLRVITV